MCFHFVVFGIWEDLCVSPTLSSSLEAGYCTLCCGINGVKQNTDLKGGWKLWHAWQSFSVGEAGAGISSLPQVFACRIETAAFAGVQLSVCEALPELPASQLGIVRAPGGAKWVGFYYKVMFWAEIWRLTSCVIPAHWGCELSVQVEHAVRYVCINKETTIWKNSFLTILCFFLLFSPATIHFLKCLFFFFFNLRPQLGSTTTYTCNLLDIKLYFLTVAKGRASTTSLSQLSGVNHFFLLSSFGVGFCCLSTGVESHYIQCDICVQQTLSSGRPKLFWKSSWRAVGQVMVQKWDCIRWEEQFNPTWSLRINRLSCSVLLR